MDQLIRPGAHIALRLPSDQHKLVEIQPNAQISLGKFGIFDTNHLIGRPFHLTYEITDSAADGAKGASNLRIVPAAELHAGVDEPNASTYSPSEETTPQLAVGETGPEAVTEYELLAPDGQVVLRSNADINDDRTAQALTYDEIELLKRDEAGSGRDVVAKILASHRALDKKSGFSLAKYTLRKTRKFMRRFTPLPLDAALLASITLNEREASRILEMREEVMALACSWANVHCSYADVEASDPDAANRWLAVDETGGLVVAAMAERMGILHAPAAAPEANGQRDPQHPNQASSPAPHTTSPAAFEATAVPETTNTITLVHANPQPNLSLLPFFGYSPTNPDSAHPLHTRLKTLTWLQLLHPEEDSFCIEPPQIDHDELATYKSGRRSAYYRKRRRWQRTVAVVDDARAGSFAGLVVASVMEPAGVLHRCVPLLRGGAQVVVYSANLEALTALQDCYSTARRRAFAQLTAEERDEKLGGEDFPVDPTLLLATTVQTVRARPWQVLPGRTHPLMTGKGGSDGCVFVGTRVLPSEGVTARGTYDKRKRRKKTDEEETAPSDTADD